MTRWTSIPSDKLVAWRAIFQASREGIDLMAQCPVCGARTLHRFFLVGEPVEVTLRGQRFRARGAGWEWCSSCRTFEHFSGYVPEWWMGDDLDVEKQKLTALPDALEEALLRRARD